jgi:hypothetical protein
VTLAGHTTLGLLMTRALLVTLFVLSALAAESAAAHASCAAQPSVRDQIGAARLVFVGTVVATSDSDRIARVRVESIWKGPDLPAYVDVHGSPVSGQNAASSIDRHYRAGDRDLFVLFSENAPLQDNSCSATQPYTAELAALAPADARSPAPAATGDQIQDSNGRYWLPILVVAVIVVAAAAFIGRRRWSRS